MIAYARRCFAIDNRELKHTRFWDADGKQQWAVFPHNSSSHNHIYSAKYVSRLGMISIKSWETPLSWHTECSLQVAVQVSKMRVLKLPNADGYIVKNFSYPSIRFSRI